MVVWSSCLAWGGMYRRYYSKPMLESVRTPTNIKKVWVTHDWPPKYQCIEKSAPVIWTKVMDSLQYSVLQYFALCPDYWHTVDQTTGSLSHVLTAILPEQREQCLKCCCNHQKVDRWTYSALNLSLALSWFTTVCTYGDAVGRGPVLSVLWGNSLALLLVS